MNNPDILVRHAESKDFDVLYKLGCQTPEFEVSSSGRFMEPDEFMFAIENPKGALLVAESGGAIAGFIYANRNDPERAQKTKWACIVYIVVKSEFRKQGIAQKLYDECIKELKGFGISKVYTWANTESDGNIVQFMNKNGFSEGHKYVWMDREI
jgi:ribosomal protein S18 acetylase RimI-like enzyme